MVRHMIRFAIYVVAAMRMILPVSAAETGTLHVVLDYGEENGMGTVVLHYVAEPANDDYCLLEELGGGIVRTEDIYSPDLADWLADRAGEGERLSLDANGSAVYSGLTEGLYLLTQSEAPSGWSCAEPFLITIPLNGQWNVEAHPKTAELITESPRTGQHPAPLLGAVGLVLSGTALYFFLEKIMKR